MSKPPPLPESIELVAKLDEFTMAYLECALWSSNDESTPEGGDPISDNYGFEDCDPDFLKDAIKDCTEFQQRCAPLLLDGLSKQSDRWPALASAGHDFWLTRNGHGAGFGDGDWVDPVDGWLREAAKKYGEITLYVGDDRHVYAM